MNDIRSLLTRAARRLAAARFLVGAHWGLVGIGILGVLLVLLAKASPSVHLPWLPLLIGAGVAVVVVGIVVARTGRLGDLSLATVVDERLALKERLSTAIAVRERADAFAQAAVQDGVAVARDARTREALPRGFPVKAPETSWIGPALLVVAGVSWWLIPQGDLFSRKSQDDALVQQAKAESEGALVEVMREIEKNEQLAEALKKQEAGDLANEQLKPEEMRTPEEIRRDAIKKMTELNQRLDDLLKGDEAQAQNALREQLANLDSPDDETKELADALKEGDFTAAKEALEKLKASAEGKSDAEKKELEKQLNSLAQSLDNLSKQQQALEQSLQRAGLDPKLAQNPAALQQALNQAKGLSEAQREQLQRAMQAQQAANQQLKNMSNSMSQCAKGMCQNGQQGQRGSQGQSGQNGQQGNDPASGGQSGQAAGMEAMLSDLEMTQQMLDAAEAAANACQSQSQGMGQCMGQMAGNCQSNSDSDQWNWINGPRHGGRNRAAGGFSPVAPTPTGTKITKEKVEVQQGPIIARQYVEGETVIGESTVPLERVVGEVATSLEQGVTEEQVPTHLRDVHKHYFGELKKRIEARQPERASDAKPAPARDGGGGSDAKPAEAPKGS